MNKYLINEFKTGASFSWQTSAVTTEQLARYAGASDDYNRIHYDDAYAREAGLGGVVAHGMLTMGFMARALVEWVGDPICIQNISARFTAVVRPGDEVEVKLVVEESNQAQSVEFSLQAFVQKKTVALGHARINLQSITQPIGSNRKLS
jgi:acyl dehydratase